MRWLLLLLAACDKPPTLTTVEPDPVRPGDRITATGTELRPDTRVVLAGDEGARVLNGWATDVGHLVVDLPSDLSPGTWSVVAVTDEGRSEPIALEVAWPAPYLPCTPERHTRSEVSLDRKLVMVDHTVRGGEVESERATLDEVAAIALERVPLEGGATCEVIRIVTSDGRRILYADDTRDLGDEARLLAGALDRPLE